MAAQYATFSRHTDAKAWLDQQETKIRQGLHLDIPQERKHTFSEALERYIRDETPVTRRIFQLRQWEEKLGPQFLSSIDEVRINDVCAGWKNEGRAGRKLGPAVLNRYLSALSVLFKATKDWGWLRKNPVREAKRYREPRGRCRYLDDAERNKLLAICKEDPYKPLYLIVVLALSTGMRREEILSLKWFQVNFSTGAIILTKTKNGDARRVAVRGLAFQLLKDHAKVRRLDSQFLFPGEKDSPQKEGNLLPMMFRHYDVRKAWERSLKKAEIKDFRFHDLRHSCASYLGMSGATDLEIAEVLGHKTLQMVKRYTHFAESHVAKVVEKMNAEVFGV